MNLDRRMEAVETHEPVVSDSVEAQKIYIERFDILKFYRIDTIDGQSFSCQFFLRLFLPDCGDLADGERDGLSAKLYIEKIEPQNVSGDVEFKKIGCESYKSENGNDLLIKMRIQGTFFLDLDLKEFPFDTQNVMIRMIYTATTGVQFIYDESRCKSSKLIDKGYMSPKHSWTPIGEKDDKGNTLLDIVTDEYEPSDRAFPSFEASFKVRRKSGWHYNFFVASPVGIISGLSLVVFSFPTDEDNGYSDRRTISLALMIAASTYRQVVTAQVPNIDYTTNLDIYIFSNFFLLSVVTVVNCLVHIWHEKFEKITAALGYISFLVWLCIQIWWFVSASIQSWWFPSWWNPNGRFVTARQNNNMNDEESNPFVDGVELLAMPDNGVR